MRWSMCVRRLGALGTGCHPTGLEVRASLTSPRRHPHWIFDKNARFFQAIVSMSSGFFSDSVAALTPDHLLLSKRVRERMVSLHRVEMFVHNHIMAGPSTSHALHVML